MRPSYVMDLKWKNLDNCSSISGAKPVAMLKLAMPWPKKRQRCFVAGRSILSWFAASTSREAIETVAVGLCRPGPTPVGHRSEFKSGGFEHLVEWCRRGQVCLVPTIDHPAIPQGAIPAELHGEFLVGPLNVAEGPIGLVILVARPPHTFQERHQQMLERLLEPFTVWLENDRRLRN